MRTKIAVQKSGRLHQASMEYLASLGFIFDPMTHALSDICKNAPLDIFYLRDDDIPRYVSLGIVDIGIAGQNIVSETNEFVKMIKILDFAKCDLIIAAPSSINNIYQLQGKRIATTYPRLLKRYLDVRSIEAQIITVNGSVEVAPELGIADAVCDIRQTGKTLKAHNLFPLARIMKSQAVLIATENQNENALELLSSTMSRKV